MNSTQGRRRIAVVGAGVSGLTAAYLLQRQADVTLYEAEDRLGGHAHTHDVALGESTYAVDSGFIVHNARTYPNLLRLFGELGVATQETEMSMSVSCRGCGLEYAGARGLSGLFAQKSNSLHPGYLRMLAQIPAFHRRARALLGKGEHEHEPTLGEFLTRAGFSRYLIRHFVVPLVSAVWSCGPELVRDYPARYLFEFLANHGMLSVQGSPTWRTVVGGSRSYVELAAKRLSSVRELTPVREVRRFPGGVHVRDDSDAITTYDAIVLATHPDQALAMLGDATSQEREVLGAFKYSQNPTVLHTDSSLLPRAPGARASWNYVLPECAPPAGRVRVSYHMNRLQRLESDVDFVVTLGGAAEIDESKVLARMNYRHPIYTPQALAAQRQLPSLGTEATTFAGAYHGWGFHEDGCRSGVQAAQRLGVTW